MSARFVARGYASRCGPPSRSILTRETYAGPALMAQAHSRRRDRPLGCGGDAAPQRNERRLTAGFGRGTERLIEVWSRRGFHPARSPSVWERIARGRAPGRIRRSSRPSDTNAAVHSAARRRQRRDEAGATARVQARPATGQRRLARRHRHRLVGRDPRQSATRSSSSSRGRRPSTQGVRIIGAAICGWS
jgi:hypothetical protein